MKKPKIPVCHNCKRPKEVGVWITNEKPTIYLCKDCYIIRCIEEEGSAPCFLKEADDES